MFFYRNMYANHKPSWRVFAGGMEVFKAIIGYLESNVRVYFLIKQGFSISNFLAFQEPQVGIDQQNVPLEIRSMREENNGH